MGKITTARRVLVTGGAGYIGSHVVRKLVEAQYQVIVLDNLSSGFRENLLHYEQLFAVDLGDTSAVENIFKSFPLDAVIHFAASHIAPESVEKPLQYFRNNVVNTLQLLELCTKYELKNFIFSSTAAVYGIPSTGIAHEDDLLTPINPYGQSKMMCELILQQTARARQFNFVILRYFNIAGADPLARMGQRSPNASNLIKLACQTALGLRDVLYIYGTDYNTSDGTCIRDYIHVEDLASAHVEALNYLLTTNKSCLLNVGYGHGYSVKEVIETVKTVTGKNFNTQVTSRRVGDPPYVVAAIDKIQKTFHWQPQYDNLEKIIADAWRFEQQIH